MLPALGQTVTAACSGSSREDARTSCRIIISIVAAAAVVVRGMLVGTRYSVDCDARDLSLNTINSELSQIQPLFRSKTMTLVDE